MKNFQKLLLAVALLSVNYLAQELCDACEEDSYEPVCGANGKTYYNDCQRECDEVVEDYPGICVGCNCPDVILPVCGDDGFSYINSCEANCHQATVVHSNRCGRNCRCEAFPTNEVCGADGRTYRNVCESRCRSVRVNYTGPCRLNRNYCDCNRNHVDPVCGVNGQVYQNACFARCVHAVIDPQGRCLNSGPRFNLYWDLHN